MRDGRGGEGGGGGEGGTVAQIRYAISWVEYGYENKIGHGAQIIIVVTTVKLL